MLRHSNSRCSYSSFACRECLGIANSYLCRKLIHAGGNRSCELYLVTCCGTYEHQCIRRFGVCFTGGAYVLHGYRNSRKRMHTNREHFFNGECPAANSGEPGCPIDLLRRFGGAYGFGRRYLYLVADDRIKQRNGKQCDVHSGFNFHVLINRC